jgi:hypothetical protein
MVILVAWKSSFCLQFFACLSEPAPNHGFRRGPTLPKKVFKYPERSNNCALRVDINYIGR